MVHGLDDGAKCFPVDHFFKYKQDDIMNYINILETIANEPNRKDLRWMAGIDDDLLKDNIRQLEFINWLKFEMLK